MAKIHKKVHHHLLTNKGTYLSLLFAVVVLFLTGMFILTRGAKPFASELSFTAQSSVASTEGSVIPASCSSGYADYAGQCDAVWWCDAQSNPLANPPGGCYYTTDCCTTSAGGSKCGGSTKTTTNNSKTYAITGGSCKDTWSSTYDSCTGQTTSGAVSTSCSCNAPYTWNGSSCVDPTPTCGTYSYTDTSAANIANYCGACPAGYHEPASLACTTGAVNTWTRWGGYGCPNAASCSGCGCIQDAPTPVNGACSATHYSCTAGTSGSNAFNGTTYTWQCVGSNGGTTASCSQTPVNGACSATHYSCAAGTSGSNVWNGTSYTWQCVGSNGGTTASCSETPAPVAVDGVCSATHYNCAAGTSGSNAFNGTTYTWQCVGSNGGGTASCSETARPDLTAGAISPTSASTGSATTLSATVSNIGSASTGASFSNFIQVATAANGGGTITDLAATTMTTLAAGGTAATSQTYTFSTGGTFSARACADKSSAGNAGTITESNEGNNCGAWTNITVTATPSITNAAVNYPNITFICNNATQWTAVRNEGTFSTSGTTSSGATVTVPITLEGNYTLTCSNGVQSASTVVNYTATPMSANNLYMDSYPRSINNNKATGLFWSVLNPINACSLSAQVVCSGGHSFCTAAQLADESRTNSTLTASTTDASDPYGPNRNIQTAVKTIAPQNNPTNNKALGTKTLLMNYTTDFILDCGGGALKKIRVMVANTNEG